MKKNFVLDTNVLLHDPNAIFAFKEHTVIIPIYVIEEIDGFKRELSERGRNARTVSRFIDDLREQGSLSEGVPTPTGGLLKVVLSERPLPSSSSISRSIDSHIMGVALDVRDAEPENTAILITKDANVRIRADAMGLITQNYDAERIDIDELYTGHAEIETDGDAVDAFYRSGGSPLPISKNGFTENQYVTLRDRAAVTHTALGKCDLAAQALKPILQARDGIWGIKPRNREQTFAFDALLSDTIKLVTLVGKAGTGKTLLAIAAGLQKSVDESVYHKLTVSRPIFPLGRDIGYLPGDVEQKLNPWMQPIYDNVELIIGLKSADKKRGRSYRELLDMGMIQIEPLTYIRGRSIPNQYIIVDEAQNLTPHEVKTIISRAGEETKIVLTGDPYQIDNPYVDASNNGLIHCVNRFRGQKIAAHITLIKGERSHLAELAANLL
jgi:PhoH-like ATPase